MAKPNGFLLVNKPKGATSFSLIRSVRRRLDVKKVGHAGTLDPFATGVMILLVGRDYTRLSNQFLNEDKEYIARARLGEATDTYDLDGKVTNTGDLIPTKEDIADALKHFQGVVMQTPPMFSAKKVKGKKLYDLARAGIEIEREPVEVQMHCELLSYEYPYLDFKVSCSKGTYIRSIAHDLGQMLGCFAHLVELTRTRVGRFVLESCLNGDSLEDESVDVASHLLSKQEVAPCASSSL